MDKIQKRMKCMRNDDTSAPKIKIFFNIRSCSCISVKSSGVSCISRWSKFPQSMNWENCPTSNTTALSNMYIMSIISVLVFGIFAVVLMLEVHHLRVVDPWSMSLLPKRPLLLLAELVSECPACIRIHLKSLRWWSGWIHRALALFPWQWLWASPTDGIFYPWVGPHLRLRCCREEGATCTVSVEFADTLSAIWSRTHRSGAGPVSNSSCGRGLPPGALVGMAHN